MNTAKENTSVTNGSVSYKWMDIDFRTYQDVLLPISDFSHSLEWVDLDTSNVVDIHSDYLLVRVDRNYSNTYREASDTMYAKSIKGTSRLNPHLVDGKYQAGEVLWGFDYGDSEYLVVSLSHPKNDDTIPERGIYRGCIVQPSLYYSDEAQWVVDENAWRAGGILDGE